MLRVENLEVKTGNAQNILTATETEIPWCLVLAQKVEQSAHVPRGLLRLPACLVRAEDSRGVLVVSRAWCVIDRRYRPWWTQGPSSVKGFPKWCADARDLVKLRTEEEAPHILGDEMPLCCRLCLGCLSIAVNQRLHLGVGGQGSGVRG